MTGKCKGRPPAITVLTATFSAVTARLRTGSTPRMCSGGMAAASRHAATRSSVGGTTGSPSVQPRLWNSSWTAEKSGASWMLDASSMIPVEDCGSAEESGQPTPAADAAPGVVAETILHYRETVQRDPFGRGVRQTSRNPEGKAFRSPTREQDALAPRNHPRPEAAARTNSTCNRSVLWKLDVPPDRMRGSGRLAPPSPARTASGAGMRESRGISPDTR